MLTTAVIYFAPHQKRLRCSCVCAKQRKHKNIAYVSMRREVDCHPIVPIPSHKAKLSWERFRTCLFSNHDHNSSAWHALNFSWLFFLFWQHYIRTSLCEHKLLRSIYFSCGIHLELSAFLLLPGQEFILTEKYVCMHRTAKQCPKTWTTRR